MTDVRTLGEMTPALRALRLLAAEYSHLPAPFVHLSPIDAARLELSLHDVDLTSDTFAVFEVWREALGIAPDAVIFRVQGNSRTRVLRAEGSFGGAEVALTAYADAPVTDTTAVGGAA
ncbi:hypothetical protein ABZ608_10100 [Streptomyces sp. NPDC013172]|uniref:hypothetical protein n=1 Tax=Streptomyces sp. NPDC013172 TaxID=3155009 RepID=UPI003401DF51